MPLISDRWAVQGSARPPPLLWRPQLVSTLSRRHGRGGRGRLAQHCITPCMQSTQHNRDIWEHNRDMEASLRPGWPWLWVTPGCPRAGWSRCACWCWAWRSWTASATTPGRPGGTSPGLTSICPPTSRCSRGTPPTSTAGYSMPRICKCYTNIMRILYLPSIRINNNQCERMRWGLCNTERGRGYCLSPTLVIKIKYSITEQNLN